MSKKLRVIVEKDNFVDHVRRICRSNIRRPCKICIKCPFQDLVLQIMEEQEWKLPDQETMKKLQN